MAVGLGVSSRVGYGSGTGRVRSGTVLYGRVRVWYGSATVLYGFVRSDTVWYGLVRSDTV